MITNTELEKYKGKAEVYLKSRFSSDVFTFNHYGIKTKSRDDYKSLKFELTNEGTLYNEVFWNERNIATIRKNDVNYELCEPKPNEKLNDNIIDHVSFVTHEFEKFDKLLKEEAISRFDVNKTHGIKISPQNGLIIELRNNDIVESVKDFANS